MNHLDRIRLTRVLDSAGHPGAEIINTITRAGIDLRISYIERNRTHMNNGEHDL